MSYPDEPTIHESINQFFNFVEEFSQREDFDDAIVDYLIGEFKKDNGIDLKNDKLA